MHRHPTQGIKGAKPRLPKTNGKLPTKAEISRLSKEYLEVRNVQMRAKAFMAETNATARRDELIEKRLVEQQAAYLLVAMRQKILNIPQAWARRMLGLTDAAQASRVLKELAISLLNDLKDLPAKVTDPHWLEKVEEKDA
jgi:hypothetical protein